VLNEHRSVRQSVVIASDDERGWKRLLGYVVAEEGVTAAELKRHVRDRLPEYMVPEAILVLEEMPLTASGKIDRKRLPLIKQADRQVEQEYTGARTGIEEMLVRIFEEVLKANRIGVQDNFFEIGGHSLLATQVISRVREAFGVEVGVRSVFEDATVERLGCRSEEALRDARMPVESLLFNLVDRPVPRLAALDISSGHESRLNYQDQGDWENSETKRLLSIKRKGIDLSTESAGIGIGGDGEGKV
jgi:AMP-binding enzyme C-terminal domain/Phosphopantetheine attachment site